MRNWILPENISDVLPREARQIETMRSSMLDLFARYGYELVLPPLIEYIESLFVEDDAVLNLKTFKLVDQQSGRQMGLRADITPQVARIDAHILNRKGVTRLCYAGSVVRTQPDGILATREPRQIGAEVYGAEGVAADVEVIELMLASLKLAGLPDVRVDVGHIGLFHALADAAGFKGTQREKLFTAVQLKDLPCIRTLVDGVSDELARGLVALPALYGSEGVLARAATELPALPAVTAALARLAELEAALAARDVMVCFDLAELRSSDYHSGLMFAAYAPGFNNAVARGGRYDSVGEKFGRSRPATGFSLDLRQLTQLPFPDATTAILAPAGDDVALRAAIASLRAAGETVVVDLGVCRDEAGCDRQLVERNGAWQVESL
ncbi:ATP phosphoribosyltransferase regulatory subunit [Chitinibacteraceae bacterium HSL-7]